MMKPPAWVVSMKNERRQDELTQAFPYHYEFSGQDQMLQQTPLVVCLENQHYFPAKTV